MLIDMQVSCIRPHGYTIRRLRECGLEEAVRQYGRQLASAIPNPQRVLERACAGGQVVFHVHLVALRGPRSSWHVQLTRRAPLGSEESQLIEELRPAPERSTSRKRALVCSRGRTWTSWPGGSASLRSSSAGGDARLCGVRGNGGT